ncbi:MAG: Ldh family oxidoreductase, partial [Pseudomonadota bacterium]
MVQERELVPFLTNVLTRYGAQVEQASIVCKSLVWSDLVGRVTHGVWRFPTYLKRFRAGLLRCPCNPTIEKTGAGTCRIDGDGGFGHYVGFIAMQNAIEQAREAGCG